MCFVFPDNPALCTRTIHEAIEPVRYEVGRQDTVNCFAGLSSLTAPASFMRIILNSALKNRKNAFRCR